MRKAEKVKAALKRRQAFWNDLVSDGFKGPNTKMVRHDHKLRAFHKPGSQNARKGSSGRTANR